MVGNEAGDGTAVMNNAASSSVPGFAVACSIAEDHDWPDYRPRSRKRAVIDPKILGTYIGVCDYPAGFCIRITRDGDRLFAEVTGRDRDKLLQDANRVSFRTAIDVPPTFRSQAAPDEPGLILHNGGEHFRGQRRR
jgi:hypothetical protein